MTVKQNKTAPINNHEPVLLHTYVHIKKDSTYLRMYLYISIYMYICIYTCVTVLIFFWLTFSFKFLRSVTNCMNLGGTDNTLLALVTATYL
jgi:hypothetical protein